MLVCAPLPRAALKITYFGQGDQRLAMPELPKVAHIRLGKARRLAGNVDEAVLVYAPVIAGRHVAIDVTPRLPGGQGGAGRK